MAAENTSVFSALRHEEYRDKLGYPAFLLSLLSKVSEFLTQEKVSSAANALMLLYSCLPSELRGEVNARLLRDDGVNAYIGCLNDLIRELEFEAKNGSREGREKAVKLLAYFNLPFLARLRSPVFLYLFHVGNDEAIIDLSACASFRLKQFSPAPPRFPAGVALSAAEGNPPNFPWVYSRSRSGLRLRVLHALQIIIDVLAEHGLLMEKREVWEGEA